MKRLTLTLGCILLAGPVDAAEPIQVFLEGSRPTLPATTGECADVKCEHGIQDDLPLGGPAVSDTQSLGIRCESPSAGAMITHVGFLSEVWFVAGDVDLVIRDANTDAELSRTTVFVPAGEARCSSSPSPPRSSSRRASC